MHRGGSTRPAPRPRRTRSVRHRCGRPRRQVLPLRPARPQPGARTVGAAAVPLRRAWRSRAGCCCPPAGSGTRLRRGGIRATSRDERLVPVDDEGERAAAEREPAGGHLRVIGLVLVVGCTFVADERSADRAERARRPTRRSAPRPRSQSCATVAPAVRPTTPRRPFPCRAGRASHVVASSTSCV